MSLNQVFGICHLVPTRLLVSTLCAFVFFWVSTFQASAATRFAPNVVGDEVTDTYTGLIWRRCAEGQNWDGSHCSGSYTSLSWAAALAHARTQARTTALAWRVPNVKELSSLVNPDAQNPASYTVFPDTPGDAFWTSTAHSLNPQNAWIVYFNDGMICHDSRNYGGAVRLVRTAQ